MRSLHAFVTAFIAGRVVASLQLRHVHELIRAFNTANTLDGGIASPLLTSAVVEAVLAKTDEVVASGLHRIANSRIRRKIFALRTVVDAAVNVPPIRLVVRAWVHAVLTWVFPTRARVERTRPTGAYLHIELRSSDVAPRIDGLKDEVFVHTVNFQTIAITKASVRVGTCAKSANAEANIVPVLLIESFLRRLHTNASEGPVHARERHVLPLRPLRRAIVACGRALAQHTRASSWVFAAATIRAIVCFLFESAARICNRNILESKKQVLCSSCGQKYKSNRGAHLRADNQRRVTEVRKRPTDKLQQK
jgi:hypothetical protein